MDADDLKYIVGRMDQMENKFDAKLEKMESKIDTLLRFKWQAAGGLALILVFINAALRLVK